MRSQEDVFSYCRLSWAFYLSRLKEAMPCQRSFMRRLCLVMFIFSIRLCFVVFSISMRLYEDVLYCVLQFSDIHKSNFAYPIFTWSFDNFISQIWVAFRVFLLWFWDIIKFKLWIKIFTCFFNTCIPKCTMDIPKTFLIIQVGRMDNRFFYIDK